MLPSRSASTDPCREEEVWAGVELLCRREALEEEEDIVALFKAAAAAAAVVMGRWGGLVEVMLCGGENGDARGRRAGDGGDIGFDGLRLWGIIV